MLLGSSEPGYVRSGGAVRAAARPLRRVLRAGVLRAARQGAARAARALPSRLHLLEP